VRAKSKDVLSVEQTAQVLGIGRQTAYAQCRLNLRTERREGIPCHRISTRILVYRAELEAWLGFPIVLPPADEEPQPPPAVPAPAPPATAERRQSPRRARRVPPEQGTLPF
jgi:hypothetical protein